MKTFIFTYGTDSGFPFRGGWTEIQASDINSAARIFKEYHPSRDGGETLNCADYYDEEAFKKSEMYVHGNFGKRCVEVIGAFQSNETSCGERICCICGDKFYGYGHNAQPLNDGYCCEVCHYTVVVPARLKKTGADDEKQD